MLRFQRNMGGFCLGLCCALTAMTAVADDDPAQLIAVVRSIDNQGHRQSEAVRAAAELSHSDASVLPAVLAAMDDANPLAINWLRGVFEAVADRTLRSGGTLPVRELHAYFGDRAHDPRGRRLAYEWIIRVDPADADRIIPEMLDDPSSEMRRDAVARLIAAAEAFAAEDRLDEARTTYRQALTGAVDDDQVQACVAPLREMGDEVDLQSHFGFLADWHLLGPFDNREEAGFDVAYPPEQEVDFQKQYEGQLGPVRWQAFHTDDPYGVLDIAELTEPFKGAITYATAEFVSDRKQQVEFRLGTANAWKLWLNGQQLFAHEEYHRGMQLDQYAVRGVLQPGSNEILLKVCQNEQTEDWAQKWSFQLRVCDLSGRGLHSAAVVRPARAAGSGAPSPRPE